MVRVNSNGPCRMEIYVRPRKHRSRIDKKGFVKMGLGEYLKRKRSASVVDTRNRKQKTNRNEAKNKDSIPSKTKSASIDARPSKRVRLRF